MFLENLLVTIHLACTYFNRIPIQENNRRNEKRVPIQDGLGFEAERNYKEGVSEKTQLLVPEILQYINLQNYM